jgi:hypothetical protein
MVNAERQRLDVADGKGVRWRRWESYLFERQRGTVCAWRRARGQAAADRGNAPQKAAV